MQIIYLPIYLPIYLCSLRSLGVAESESSRLLPTTHITTTVFSILAAVICKTKSIALLIHLTTSQYPADVILVHSVAITVMIHCCVYKISFSVVFRLDYIIVLLLCTVFTAILIENIGCQCQCQ